MDKNEVMKLQANEYVQIQFEDDTSHDVSLSIFNMNEQKISESRFTFGSRYSMPHGVAYGLVYHVWQTLTHVDIVIPFYGIFIPAMPVGNIHKTRYTSKIVVERETFQYSGANNISSECYLKIYKRDDNVFFAVVKESDMNKGARLDESMPHLIKQLMLYAALIGIDTEKLAFIAQSEATDKYPTLYSFVAIVDDRIQWRYIHNIVAILGNIVK